tara:strand:+ start:610 stop:1170 length:561 start_codon:yes stop_codon:yes gene_type:complete
MDPDGHPSLSEPFVEQFRTFALQDILNNNFNDRTNNVIVSTAFDSDKMNELYKQATIDKGWKWYKVGKDTGIQALKELLSDNDFDLNPRHTTMIFGGTNTSGCILAGAKLSMSRFAQWGCDCKLYLPLCDDPQIPAIGAHDKGQLAFSEVYNYLKRNKLFDNVDIIFHEHDLQIIKSKNRFEFEAT